MDGKEKNALSKMRQPRQPIGFDEDGIVRFKANEIVRLLLEESKKHGFGLNEIARAVLTEEVPIGDAVQFWQLLGYSVSGYGDLSFIPKKEIEMCDALAAMVLSEAE
ncbi:MAG TPA: hypothetical protein VFA98_09355 [Thermoanaerobaculia bacterium]|nr:hypothetical protein [Thermoanaerobaculia bacterium]